MLTRAFSALLILVTSLRLEAQQVEWANAVIDFSAEVTPREFSARQVLGKPNVLPATKIHPNAWTPGSRKKEHFIHVGFKNPIRIRQIAIAESYNPGAIKSVIAIDTEGGEHQLFTLEPKVTDQKGRMFNFFMSETLFQVSELKIRFDGQLTKSEFFIDAIGISDSNIPVRAVTNFNPLMRRDLVVEPLSENVNGPESEIRPLLSPDGKVLYFSRKNSPQNLGGEKDSEDIWTSSFNEETKAWDPAENLGAPLNNRGKNFMSSVTPYGNMTLAVLGNKYAKNDKMKAGISVSNYSANGWSQPVSMDFSNDPNLGGDFDLTISGDRKQIIMATRREDTHGGKDLYVSFLQRTAVWSEPINLGSIINSGSDESSPFLDADGKTLYFSSRGFSGFGKSDIYVSKRLDDSWTNWSEPQNLGSTVNSELEEKYFNIPSTGDYAYFSRYAEPDNADIYRVELPLYESNLELIAVTAKIVDEVTGEVIESSVSINQKMAVEGNSFKVNLEAGRIYQCRVQADGYLLHDELIDLTGEDVSEKLDVEIKLKKKAEIITFENITFASSQAMLLEKSFDSLDEVARILQENPEISLEIASHTDNVGSEEENLALSRLRAEVIRGYLVERGADPEKIKLSWFGESQPVASNETEDGRSKNRRVEFIIRR